jgi:hypothetical protein
VPFENAGALADVEQGERERARDRLAEAHDFGRRHVRERPKRRIKRRIALAVRRRWRVMMVSR